MEKTLFKRRDLVKSFPTSFAFSALKDHFSREYLSVVGCHANEKCLKYLVGSFMLMWKATKKREKDFSTHHGNDWLEKKLPMPLDLPATPQCKDVTPKEVKLRKPFTTLSERGRRRRMETLFTRTPQADELEFFREKTVKR